jgi:hypothetical protein
MRRYVLIFVVLCLAIASSAAAQIGLDPEACPENGLQTQAGDEELVLGAGFQSVDAGAADLDQYRIGVTYGRFFTDTTELLFIGQYNRAELGVEGYTGSVSDTAWEVSAGVAFHVATASQTVPFAALKVGIWDLGGSGSDMLWGAAVGMKHYVGEGRMWVAELVYQDSDVDCMSVDGWAINLGMGFRFR